MKWKAVLLAAAFVFTTSTAFAQSPKAEARDLFNAGVSAYKQGQFLTAAQAFMKAHKLLPKPQLLFSIAQAFKRQFDDKQEQQPLVMAVKYYRQYLDEVKDGGRRLEAAKALGDLKPYLQGVGGDAAGEMVFPTRLSVNSPTPGAVVQLDDGPVYGVPWNTQIKPGTHKITLHASGYESQTKTFSAQQGDILPFAIPLRGKQPTLEVLGADGAEVVVDGRVLGSAPFSQPLTISPGTHFVAVTDRGHKAYSGEISFEYGGKTKLELDLPMTNQRRVSFGVLAVGGAGVVASGVLLGFALANEATAKDIQERRASGTISPDERVEHNSALETRDDLVVAAAIAAGAGGAVAITGLFLFLFDEPIVTPPLTRGDDEDEGPQDDEGAEIEVIAAPAVGPGVYGVSLIGRF